MSKEELNRVKEKLKSALKYFGVEAYITPEVIESWIRKTNIYDSQAIKNLFKRVVEELRPSSIEEVNSIVHII
jgi:hypothetical protein